MSPQDERDRLLAEFQAVQGRIARAGRFTRDGGRLSVEEAKLAQRWRSLMPGLNGPLAESEQPDTLTRDAARWSRVRANQGPTH
jgi:hypothetical protein